jgi:hypothetical protein
MRAGTNGDLHELLLNDACSLQRCRSEDVEHLLEGREILLSDLATLRTKESQLRSEKGETETERSSPARSTSKAAQPALRGLDR